MTPFRFENRSNTVILVESSMDQWLIRTAENWIAGPYTKEQVCKMVEDRQLGQEDEVCSANGYWIYSNELNEVREQLGIQVPRKVSQHDEDTQTSILNDEEPTDPEIILQPEKSLRDLPDSVTENTGVIDASQFRELKASQKKKATSAPHKPDSRNSSVGALKGGGATSPKPFLAIEVKGHQAETWLWQKLSLIILALAGFGVGIAFLYRVKH